MSDIITDTNHTITVTSDTITDTNDTITDTYHSYLLPITHTCNVSYIPVTCDMYL